MRLNHFIAKSGYASRRKADLLIKEGAVLVNRETIQQPFFQVSQRDKISIRGKLLTLPTYIYVIFNKPQGVTTTLSDKFAHKKIVDFFTQGNSSSKMPALSDKGIYPVGRLDKDSTGLIILTNDGDLCYKATHPKFGIEKEYLIKLNGEFSALNCKQAKRGINNQGDFLKVDAIRIIRSSHQTLCKVVVCEGKKRHLRRLFKSLGFEVKSIKRIRIGKLTLGELREGQYKLVSKEKTYSLLFGGQPAHAAGGASGGRTNESNIS